MVPGQHHVRMNMYIAQSHGGAFRIVKRLGAIDPNERLIPNARITELAAAVSA
jgi:branched-chain amino acid transport system substrate-binding protein